MGEIIQIRLMAKTYDPEEAKKRWGELVEAAFQQDNLQVQAGEDFHVRLVDALYDRYRLKSFPSRISLGLGSEIEKALEQRNRLLQCLSDWDPRGADKAAYALEDLLDLMEHKITRC